MKVYVNGYGLAEFKPTQVYRFDGREDLTQLRGRIRIIRDDLEVRLGTGEEWMDYNYWFDLYQVIFEDNADVNQVIGLPVLTMGDLDREEQEQHLCNKCGKPISECCKDIDVPKPGVDSGLYLSAENLKRIIEDVEQDGDSWKWATSQWTTSPITAELGPDEDVYYVDTEADDTDIEEEIQRVLVGLKSTDIHTNTYQALLSTLKLLIDIREKI